MTTAPTPIKAPIAEPSADERAQMYEETKQKWINAVEGDPWIEPFVRHVMYAPPHVVAQSVGYLIILESILATNQDNLKPRTVMAQWPDMPEWWQAALFNVTPKSRLEMRRARADIEEMQDLAVGHMRYGLLNEQSQ